MSRVIKFRGLRKDGKGFEAGTYVPTEKGKVYISNQILHEIKPNTIGQFTGLHDKNGVEIYEGDILKRIVTIKVFGSGLPSEDVEDTVTVEWREDYAGFYIGERVLFAEIDATHCSHTGCRCTKFEVIGNIYEDPNLLGSA